MFQRLSALSQTLRSLDEGGGEEEVQLDEFPAVEVSHGGNTEAILTLCHCRNDSLKLTDLVLKLIKSQLTLN